MYVVNVSYVDVLPQRDNEIHGIHKLHSVQKNEAICITSRKYLYINGFICDANSICV